MEEANGLYLVSYRTHLFYSFSCEVHDLVFPDSFFFGGCGACGLWVFLSYPFHGFVLCNDFLNLCAICACYIFWLC